MPPVTEASGAAAPPAHPRRYKRDPEALGRFREALAVEPHSPVIRRLYAMFLLGQGSFTEALPLLESLGEEGRTEGDWNYQMALALLGLGREAEAEALVDTPESCAKLGYQAADLGRWGAFGQLTAKALSLAPEAPGAVFDRAIALDYLGEYRSAIALLEDLEARPGLDPALKIRARMHRGQSLLLLGDLLTGFRLMESRLPTLGLPPLPYPEWDGSDMAGTPLLVRGEQGYGDFIMGLRYIPLLARRGARVFVEPMEGTVELLRTCPGVAGLLGEVALPPGTQQVQLLSLPHLLGTHTGDIPAPIPYLSAAGCSPNRPRIEAAIRACPGRRLGLVWAGHPRHPRDAERSIPPTALAPLASVPGVTWFSLQKSDVPRPEIPLMELGPLLGDFSDTALALELLDGVVTVDTSVAHLAGALGRPGWVLLNRFPDWRWLLDRGDSPWYPSLRLRRQSRHWDWATLVRQVATELGGH
nr:tetratricopeptide repeat protein [uncultured Holophaga sp.]